MKIFTAFNNYNEKFPHLDKAPIVEAVIDLQVISIAPWDDKLLMERLKTQLSGYPKIEETRQIKHILVVGRVPNVEDGGCVGLRTVSADGCYIAQFNRTGFTLSRVKKYENWTTFCLEANRLWSLYRELLRPSGIKRIGVRYINRMLADYSGKEFIAVFNDRPKDHKISGWELENFLYRDVLRVPNTDYRVNLVRTLASSATKQNEISAIVDNDVYYCKEVSCEWEEIEKHLKIMHWIKNKAFFASVNKNKLKEYR